MAVCVNCEISEVKAGMAFCGACNREYQEMFGEDWKERDWGEVVNEPLATSGYEKRYRPRMTPQRIDQAIAYRYGAKYVGVEQYEQMIRLDADQGLPVYYRNNDLFLEVNQFDDSIKKLMKMYPEWGAKRIFNELDADDEISLSTVKRRMRSIRAKPVLGGAKW